jgi:hypothetical protein
MVQAIQFVNTSVRRAGRLTSVAAQRDQVERSLSDLFCVALLLVLAVAVRYYLTGSYAASVDGASFGETNCISPTPSADLMDLSTAGF